jgi:hypothetical protein
MPVSNAPGSGPNFTTLDDILKVLDTEEASVFADLGMDVVMERMPKLPAYTRYQDVVRVNRDVLTPRQMSALAQLADTLGPNVVLMHNGAHEPISEVEMVRTVIRNEIYDRKHGKS